MKLNYSKIREFKVVLLRKIYLMFKCPVISTNLISALTYEYFLTIFDRRSGKRAGDVPDGK